MTGLSLNLNLNTATSLICNPGSGWHTDNRFSMPTSHTSKATELDPRGVTVHLSAGVQKAFGDLAAAVHFSEHFDGDMYKTLQDLAAGKPTSVDDLIGDLPLLAEETFKHVHATGDKRAAVAWHEIASELVERGFTLAKDRVKRK
jgi:hypothetical protein